MEVCHAYAGPHDIVYKTTKTVCMLARPKQSQGRYSTRVGNEELSFVFDLRYLGHVMTADLTFKIMKDIKKQFMRQNAVGNKLVRKFSFSPTEAKIQCSYIVTQFMHGCALWRYSYQNSIRKLTVSYRFKRLINVPRYTSSSLAFAMNTTDLINVVFRKISLQLDEQYCYCHCQ